MYKLMIVEDEAFVRFGLENAISWEDYQIQVVSTPQNGKEALEAYYKYHPHIIITDIKMPIMSGLEMMQEIRKTDQDVKFIVLTCMENFSSIQEAVKYAVSDYLTKYDTDIDELRDKIVEICKSIRISDTDLPLETDTDRTRIVSPLQVEYLYGKSEHSEYDIMDFIRINRIPTDGCYAMINLVLKMPEKTDDQESYLQNMMLEIIKPQKQWQLLAIKEGELAIVYTCDKSIAQEDKQYEEVISGVNFLLKMSKAYAEISAYAIVGDFFTDITQLKNRFRSVLNKDYVIYYLPRDEIYFFYVSYDMQIRKAIEKEIKAVNVSYQESFGAEYSEEFCGYAEKFNSVDFSDVRAVGNLIIGWVQLLFVIFHLLKKVTIQYMDKIAQMILTADSFVSALQVLLDIIKKTKEEQEKKVSFEMMKAVAYIQNNLHLNPTLPLVAEHVNFSTGYLSFIFKKELNMSFTEFILKLRIKKAKLMLEQSDKKLYEIAEQTGWYDQSYFVKMFKRFVGVTPNTYRKRHKNKGGNDTKSMEGNEIVYEVER